MKRPLRWIKNCWQEFTAPFKGQESLSCPTFVLGIFTRLILAFYFIVILTRTLDMDGLCLYLLIILFCIVVFFDFMFQAINSNKKHREIMDAIKEIKGG